MFGAAKYCCVVFDGTYSVGLDISRFHLGQKVSRGKLELILQVNLQQGVVVTDIILSTWGAQCENLYHLQHKITPLQKHYELNIAGNCW